ncbi:MAG: uroporphyrinogen-III synthase [Thermoanaerobaculia bacterium]
MNGKPLEGTVVVVTRPEPPGGPLATMLMDQGARVLHWPAVRIEPPEDPGPLESALERLSGYDWIVFASPRAVAAVVQRRQKWPGAVRIAAVGAATGAELCAAGWPVQLTARPARGDALVRAFETISCAGARILFPASSIARRTIPRGLRRLGAEVDQVIAYRAAPAPLEREACQVAIASGEISAVTFASPSSVAGLRRALGAREFRRLLECAPAVTIGPTTSRALRQAGCPVARVAQTSTLEGLARAVEKALEDKGEP